MKFQKKVDSSGCFSQWRLVQIFFHLNPNFPLAFTHTVYAQTRQILYKSNSSCLLRQNIQEERALTRESRDSKYPPSSRHWLSQVLHNIPYLAVNSKLLAIVVIVFAIIVSPNYSGARGCIPHDRILDYHSKNLSNTFSIVKSTAI